MRESMLSKTTKAISQANTDIGGLLNMLVIGAKASRLKCDDDVGSIFALRKKYVEYGKAYEALEKEDLLEFYEEVIQTEEESDEACLERYRKSLKDFFDIVESVDKAYLEIQDHESKFAKMFIHPFNVVRLWRNLNETISSDDLAKIYEKELKYVISNEYFFNQDNFNHLLNDGAIETNENGDLVFGFINNQHRIDRCETREKRFLKKGYGSVSLSMFIASLAKLKARGLLDSHQVSVLSMLMLNKIAYVDFDEIKDLACLLHFYYLVTHVMVNESVSTEEISSQNDYKIMVSFCEQVREAFTQASNKIQERTSLETSNSSIDMSSGGR